MAITIEEYSMTAESDGSVLAIATWVGGDEWIVAAWPRYFTRDQATTALTLAERLAAGYGDDDPFVTAWREELRRG
jgi:hypothetical protein